MSVPFHIVLEVFSVELWREIFDYFNVNELWYSFRGLNKKIDAIIDQTILYLDFQKKGSYHYFIKNILPTMNIINVRSLKLRESNEIQHLFSIYSLDSFVQLRLLSLNFMHAFNDNKFQFWKQLSSLKYLRSLKIMFWSSLDPGPDNSIEEKEFIIRSIFNNDYCPLLRYLNIETSGRSRWKTGIPSLITTTKATNIKYLSIDSLTFNDLIKLLPALKNLKILCIDYQLSCDEKPNEQIQNMTTISALLPKCLKMKLILLDNMMFEHVEYILRQTPNLKNLFLWGWCHLLNAKRWELLLSTQCPRLIRLELICTGLIGDDDFDDKIDNFQEECGRTPFWSERNFTITDDEDRSGHDYRYDAVVRFNIKKVNFIKILVYLLH